jgi:putative peptidoglycan lipid II flippase
MGRPGEFYDQDQPPRPEQQTGGPSRAGFGMLYDQDHVDQPGDWRDGLRRRREVDRRLREQQLRRQMQLQQLGSPPSPPVEMAPSGRASIGEPVRISSRPAPLAPPDTRRRPPSREAAASATGRATVILATGTLASRLTGFLRVLTIAYVLGIGSLSDAFNYANGIPNIVYDLVLGGILAATLIPVFVEQLERHESGEGVRAISAVVTAIGVALVAISALLWLLAPYVIHFYLLLSPSSVGPPERALATSLLRYFAPQVFFLGAIVVSTALLNARRHFTAPAFSPVANNLIAIAALLATKVVAEHVLTAKSATGASTLRVFAHDRRAMVILGVGTTLGYVVQLLIQWPAMRRVGYRLRLVWDLRHPAVRKVARLSTWLIGVVLANQISLALVMVLAGRTQGGVTAYQFSYQFFQLPYALIAVSVASAIMPDLASRWTSGDQQGFENQFSGGLRVTLAVLVPVAGVYVAVAQPFIELAIHHGRVGQSGAHLMSSSLALFAVGLPGFAAYFLLIRVYQATQDGRGMFWIYALENTLTIIAAVILDPLIGVPGLALAWVGPYTIAAVVAAVDLRRRGRPHQPPLATMDWGRTLRTLVRVALAGTVAVGATVLVGLPFPSVATSSDAVLVGRLILQTGIGAAVYIALARVMRIEEVGAVLRLGRRLVGAE